MTTTGAWGHVTRPDGILVSAAKMARQIGVSRATMWRWCDSGKVPGAVKSGRNWKIPARVVAEIREGRLVIDPTGQEST